jgi:hypothetical protein
LPDTLSEYAAGASAAFATKIVAIRPTTTRFDHFNGINVGRANYVNVNADASFIYTACTKLNPMGIRALEQLFLDA